MGRGQGGCRRRKKGGSKEKKRRFRAAAGIARLSVVKARSLCSILCASHSRMYTIPLDGSGGGVSEEAPAYKGAKG